MPYLSLALGLVVISNLILLLLVTLLLRKNVSISPQTKVLEELASQASAAHQALSAQFAVATADMATRLEQTKGDLRQQVADRLGEGFSSIRSALDDQMLAGRREQSARLTEVRTELASSLALTASQLKSEFETLNQKTAQSLDSIRDRVDVRLLAITDQVQQKLDQNIKEGFAHFEKVQQHLKAAEEQLREVGALGH